MVKGKKPCVDCGGPREGESARWTVCTKCRDAYIQGIVDAVPPLTPEQRARLRELLRPRA